MASYFKIKVNNIDHLKRAKKIAFVGFSKADGVGIYKSISYGDKEEIKKYLTSLEIEVLSLSKLSSMP